MERLFTELDRQTKDILEVLESESPKINEQLAILIAQSVTANCDAVIDTCDHGHRFAKLEDHPVRNGRALCPYCMTIGLKTAWTELGALTNNVITLRAAASMPDLKQ